jgi:hypothetical protein
MKLSRRHFIGATIAATAGASASVTLLAPWKQAAPPPAPALPALPATVPAAAKQARRPAILDKALAALDAHRSRVVKRNLLGVVDFSAHSSERRLHLVDVANGRIVSSHLVAHGRGSDPGHTGWVKRFSNDPGSNASSQGSFLLANAYVGKHGRSRRLLGLDPENSLALERAIVIHGASYVSEDMVDSVGQIGRSLGCFAVAETRIDDLLEALGEGHLLFASK